MRCMLVPNSTPETKQETEHEDETDEKEYSKREMTRAQLFATRRLVDLRVHLAPLSDPSRALVRPAPPGPFPDPRKHRLAQKKRVYNRKYTFSLVEKFGGSGSKIAPDRTARPSRRKPRRTGPSAKPSTT